MKPKHLICTEAWDKEALKDIIALASRLKNDGGSDNYQRHLAGKIFMLLFFNPSLRTLTSFEAAIASLGGIPVYRTPEMLWFSKGTESPGEAIKDIAKVISTYCVGIGIRILLDKAPYYGYGHELLHEFSRSSAAPVISMADDTFHPCQGLADLMTWAEAYSHTGRADLNSLTGKTLLVTWARSRLIRPRSSVQSHLLLASRFGMNIVLARPDGYDLDPDVYKKISAHCKENHTHFQITSDPDAGYAGAHVVLVRHWISEHAYQHNTLQAEQEVERASQHAHWITTATRMQRTADAIFTNPMPIDRGYEAEEVVIDGKKSMMFEVVKNRLHIEKAILLQVT